MKKAAHLYANNAITNSGDFLIGPATKHRFLKIIGSSEIEFTNFDIRQSFTEDLVNLFNANYDYLVIGAGGLILPDTKASRNSVSGWQWDISINLLEKIKIPIYVISIGYNVFFNQTMAMPNRNSNNIDIQRYNTFKKHIATLVSKSTYFTMRHTNDIQMLLLDIGTKYKNKISFEFCPTIEYTREKKLISKSNAIAFEIKDDRLWRRTYSIGVDQYYFELKKTILQLIFEGKKVYFLSHDGSNQFYKYLLKNKITLEYIDNTCANEDQIYNNYLKFGTIVCTAGHSQMISSAIKNINVISIVTHPKILNFCLDLDSSNYIEPNINHKFSNALLSLIN